MSKNDKYDYFVKKVANLEELWSLYNDGWAMIYEDNGDKRIPFWPNKVFAEVCAKKHWYGYKPEVIDIYNFLENWLKIMENKKILPAIFQDLNGAYSKVGIDKLKDDIYSEIYHLD